MSEKKNELPGNIDRRSILLGMGAAAVAFTPLANAAMHEGHEDHKKHNHSRHSPQQPAVLNAVYGCLEKGQQCIAHCLTMFQEGDTSVADCAAKVHEMQAICGSFSYLLAANSGHVKAAAALCESVCKECADECRKHDRHIECRACAEACETAISEVQRAFA